MSLTKCLIVDLKASVPQGSKACLPSQKSEGVVYHRALLPHEAYGAPQAKLKELKRLHAEEREREWTSTFEVGQSLRLNQEPRVPDYVQMGESEVYMNFPNLLASPKVRAQAVKMARTLLFEKLQSQLLKH